MQRAHWLFLRAYALIALLVVVTGMGLETLLAQRDQQALIERESALLAGSFELVDQALDTTGDGVPLPVLQRRLSAELSLPVQLHPAADFQGVDDIYPQLLAGETLVLYETDGEAVFFRLLPEQAVVVALGPGPAFHNERAKWIVPLFYGLIALAVYLWIRPLMRDLDTLRNAAGEFGQQRFSRRVDLTQGSWMRPLGDAFNQMAQRIEWLLQSHRELTHAVSHELRTPLARMRFGLEILGGASGADRERHIKAMQQDIEELNELVEEMLGYAELEQGNLEPQLQRFDLLAWLNDYCTYYNSHGPRIELALTKAPPADILADKKLLGRALDNLVSNAQRYAVNRVELAARANAQRVEIRVDDDGPGIPEAQRQAVLSAYVRLENSEAARREGFGLGLAIVQRVMTLHGGEVVIDESPLGGAAIALRWPAQLP